jgi:hypothetical protein
VSDTDLTFVELQDQALHDDFNPLKYRARVKQKINEALGQLARTVATLDTSRLDQLATVTGNPLVALPADVLAIDAVLWGPTGVEIDPVDVDSLDGLPDTGPGIPAYWAQDGTSIRLRPAPGSVGPVLVRSSFRPTVLAGDGDKPAIPNDYRPMLSYYTRGFLFAWEDDQEMSVFWHGQWAAKRREFVADIARRSKQPRVIPGTWSNLASGPRFRHPQGLF